jgi:protein-disulfide isomerase-like protein with CxxC motif
VVTAIRSGHPIGTDIEWRFVAFSLDQAHVAEGEPAVWDRPIGERGTGVAALEWGVAVRDAFPEHFLAAHEALFAARHDQGRKLHELDTLRDAVAGVGLDPDAVAAEVASGRPLATIAAEHTEAADRWQVFGVPTFLDGTSATFIRFMERNRVDDLERALDLLDWTRMNEFKRTQLPR